MKCLCTDDPYLWPTNPDLRGPKTYGSSFATLPSSFASSWHSLLVVLHGTSTFPQYLNISAWCSDPLQGGTGPPGAVLQQPEGGGRAGWRTWPPGASSPTRSSWPSWRRWRRAELPTPSFSPCSRYMDRRIADPKSGAFFYLWIRDRKKINIRIQDPDW